MKKTVNKWLLLFASIFLMMAVACSNSTGGGDNKDKGSDTGDTPESQPLQPVPTVPAPYPIQDDNYIGIKIRIADIPTETYARRIYVNDRVAGEDFSYGNNGALIPNQYAKKSEWGYPFVQADKSYKIVVEFIGSDYKTIKRTAPLKITAKKGLGDLVCPNAEYVIEDNILKFKKGAPVIYYGNNTNIKEYSNKKSGPSYAIQVFSDGWADNQYFFFGGEDLSQNTFDFAKNLKKELVTDNKLLLRVWAGIEDKDYGGYVYQIAYDKPFYLDLDKFPEDSINIEDLYPKNSAIKGKLFKENRGHDDRYNFYAFNTEESSDKVEGALIKCTYHKDSDKYQYSYVYMFTYKDGLLDFPETDDLRLIYKNSKYFTLNPEYTFERSSGSGLDSVFTSNDLNFTITMSSKGTIDISQPDDSGFTQTMSGSYTISDGIITLAGRESFLYDGFALYSIDGILEPLKAMPTNIELVGGGSDDISEHTEEPETKPSDEKKPFDISTVPGIYITKGVAEQYVEEEILILDSNGKYLWMFPNKRTNKTLYFMGTYELDESNAMNLLLHNQYKLDYTEQDITIDTSFENGEKEVYEFTITAQCRQYGFDFIGIDKILGTVGGSREWVKKIHGDTAADLSKVIPKNKDLKGKVFTYRTQAATPEEQQDLYYAFGKDGNDTTGPLSVTMYPYSIDGTEHDDPKSYSYEDGKLTLSGSENDTTSYMLFCVNGNYYLAPYSEILERTSGNGLYGKFIFDTLSVTFNENGGVLIENTTTTTATLNENFVNDQGFITLVGSSTNYLLYDGEKIYILIWLDNVIGFNPNSSSSGNGD